MTTFTKDERRQLQAISALTFCNPFEPQRIELERTVLGNAYEPEVLDAWSRTEATDREERPNILRINQVANDLAEDLCNRQTKREGLRGDEAVLYDDLATYVLYYRHISVLRAPLEDPATNDIPAVWRAFRADRKRLLAPFNKQPRTTLASSEHLFACLHQVRRAFHGIFEYLIGESAPLTHLRAEVWRSIFTHDLRRYRRTLYNRMSELATLVTGPSGAGKELVAQAIGRSQYRAFDAHAGKFLGNDESFLPLNLSALSPTLLESELFGHCKGAFTGAVGDRAGWLERCPPHGAVFLDEIGELDPTIQVKLLRVAQTRDYSRLGETRSRTFQGKLLAATNRDMAAEMRAGRFREDLYYRLCSDRIVVPSLGEQLADRPRAISGIVRRITQKMLGDQADDSELHSLAAEVEEWITTKLPRAYPWPGNIRELEQCVRSVLVRREYYPPSSDENTRLGWLNQAEQGALSADALLTAYCRHVYQQQKGYEPAARVLGLDRRTVKSRVQGDS